LLQPYSDLKNPTLIDTGIYLATSFARLRNGGSDQQNGIGGFVGTILVAVFGSKHFAGGFGDFEILAQLKIQSLASLYTIILSGVVSYAVLKVLALTIGLRITAEQENTGIDVSEHGEEAYNG
jgi:Amt family ammonium transporter